jgi:hypothetical protein
LTPRAKPIILKKTLRPHSATRSTAMRTLLGCFWLLACLLNAIPAADDPKDPPAGDKKGPPLTVGNDLPGPFHPYNINGKFKGRYHCPVTEQALDPLFLVFTRDLAVSEPLKELLKALDNVVEKNPNQRLAVAVVFIADGLEKGIVFEDDKRDDIVAKIEEATKGLMLKHVVLTVTDKADLEKYGLDPMAAATVVLHRKYVILSSRAFPKLETDNVATVVQDLAEKLGADKK